MKPENKTGFESCSDWEIGDGCSVIFWSNGTKRVEDDVILSTRYTNLKALIGKE